MLFIWFLINLLIIKPNVDLIGSEVNLIESQFDQFIAEFGKSYQNDQEYGRRKEHFKNSLNEIEKLNSLRKHRHCAFFGITKYSDLSKEEFLAQFAKNNRKRQPSRKRVARHREQLHFNGINVPDRFDWRDRNVVSDVRNQGKCGACWAHSTVATIESMVAIKTQKLTELSVQQLVDCSGEVNQGCRGGDTCAALEWMDKNNVTLESAHQYPIKNQAESCHSKSEAVGVSIRSNYTCNKFVDREERIVQLLAGHGPLIAAVDASTWQHYLGGIIHFHCSNDLNHAVQITGYDKSGEIPFYKVRNTWDVGFGIDGYVHIAIGGNLCGIAEEISAIDVKEISPEFY